MLPTFDPCIDPILKYKITFFEYFRLVWSQSNLKQTDVELPWTNTEVQINVFNLDYIHVGYEKKWLVCLVEEGW